MPHAIASINTMTKRKTILLSLLLLSTMLPPLAAAEGSFTDKDVDASCRAASHHEKAPFITFDPVAPAFGLTNQLLTYTAAIYLALLSNRTLAIPQNTSPNFFDLIDVTATERNLPCGFAITSIDDMRKSPSKWPRMRLPGRQKVIWKGREARDVVLNSVQRLKPFRGVRLSTVMWHVPFHTMGDLLPEYLTEQYILKSLVFHPDIRSFATKIRSSMKPQFAAIHLRLEEDITAIQLSKPIKRPSADELFSFLNKCFVRSIPEGVSDIYVAAGRLDEKYMEALKRLPFNIVFKSELGLKFKRSVEAESLDKGKKITNHFEAAADLIVLGDSVLTMAADFSTFSRAIQFRKCPTSDGNGTALLTYNRNFNEISRRRCVDRTKKMKRDPRRGELDGEGNDDSLLISVPWNSMVNYEEVTEPSCRR